MEFVFVKNVSNLTQRLGQMGPTAPGETVEVSLFEYHGSLVGDPSWELVPSTPSAPDVAGAAVEEAVLEDGEFVKPSKTINKIKE